MKRSIVALCCTAVIAAVLFVPALLQGIGPGSGPTGAVGVQAAQPDDRDGGLSEAVPAADAASESDGGEGGGEPPDGPEYVPGVVLVGVADGVTADQVNERLRNLDYIATDAVSDSEIVMGILELPLAEGVEVADASARLEDEAFASFSEPNYILHIADADGESAHLQAGGVDQAVLTGQTSSVNDPQASDQWALKAVHAYEAWDYARANGAVTVAVLDTGVDLDHEDLQGNLLRDSQGIIVGYNASNSSDSADDTQGHGTHVAGIVAATANNDMGVAGVSYNAKIMPVRVTPNNSRDTDVKTVVKGINFITENSRAYNVKVINFSFGSESETSDSQALTEAFKKAHDRFGILLVSAAGNGGAKGAYHSLPCDYASDGIGVISVGSTYARGSTSNYNRSGERTKQISAPGENILSTTVNGSYGRMSGTSMAAPYVSGIAALLFAAAPDATPDDVKSALIQNVTEIGHVGWDDDTGYGLVNAEAALKAIAPDAAPRITGADVVGLNKDDRLAISGAGERVWTWSSSDTSKLSIVGSGDTVTAKGLAMGNVTVTARCEAEGITITKAISVVGKDLSLAEIDAVPDAQYTGGAITPEVTVRYDGSVLKKGSDYTVSYSNNTAVGTATATITGIGDCKGTRVVEFRIAKASLDGATVNVADQEYDGVAKEPAPTVELNGRTLVKGVDYTVSYQNNLDATANGDPALLTVVGRGNYEGTVIRQFNIAQAKLERIHLSRSKYTYDGSACSPVVNVYGVKGGATGRVLTRGADYDLVVPAGRTEIGTYTYTATGKGNFTGTVTTVLTVQEGAVASLKSMSLSSEAFTYDGNAKEPKVTVTASDGATLTQGEDFTVSYSNNVAAGGKATVTAAGKGSYSGTLQRTFTISPESIAKAAVTLGSSQYFYDGTAKRPSVRVVLNGKTLKEGTDYTVAYANNAAVGLATATVYGKGNYSGSVSRTFSIVLNTARDSSIGHSVQYDTHVQNVGWQTPVKDGQTAGTSGRSLRLEGIRISLKDKPYSGGIEYRTHIQNIGWETQWKSNGAMSGTQGQSLRLEAIQIRLTGEMGKHYDVYYRVHAQNIGWMAWAKNGASAGTAGYSYRLEAIQIVLVPKDAAAPKASPANAYGAPFKTDMLQYRTHVQNVGWQGFVADGAMSGTSGQSLRLEGINIQLGAQSGISGGVEYRTHIQNIGWETQWKRNGAMSGTSGQSLRLEAIQIRLTGTAAQQYDIYYRVHCQNIGWMGWAKNGASAGTAGYSYRLEGIQIKLVPKGAAAPGSTVGAFRAR